jgi:hypothetical protein
MGGLRFTIAGEMRTRVLILLALAATPVAVAGAQSGTSTTPTTETSPQALFSQPLVSDAKVTKAIKKLLTSKAGYVDPNPVFADLTGDGKSDAVVSVDAGGTAGAIAVYVLSTDGSSSGALHVVYRNQELYRATTAVSGATLTIANPHWSPGDDLWDPKKIVQRTYEWKASKHTLARTGTTVVAGPTTVTTVVGPGTTTPTTTPTG